MTNFYIPTKQDVLDVKIGSYAPDYTGKLKKVVRHNITMQDKYGKWFVCYSVEHGENGSVSHSLKEDKLDRNIALTRDYNSAQLDDIEAKMLKERV